MTLMMRWKISLPASNKLQVMQNKVGWPVLRRETWIDNRPVPKNKHMIYWRWLSISCFCMCFLSLAWNLMCRVDSTDGLE
jgi:hypothetical protein